MKNSKLGTETIQTPVVPPVDPAATEPAPPIQPVEKLREDGPPIEVFVEAGYPADKYPPVGFAEVPSDALTYFKANGKLPEAEPKKPAPKVYVLKNGKLTDDGRDELEKGITRCSETIGDGLRQFIENKIELGQAARGELENAFEAARTCLRKKPDLTDLEAAREGVDLVVVLLANHSVRDVLALDRAKATQAATAKTVALLTPK